MDPAKSTPRLLEEVVDAFGTWLSEEETADESVRAQQGRIRLFLLHYLHGHAGRDLEDVRPREVIEFVGTWFIRHVANAGPDAIRSTLGTLAAFFRWRARQGEIPEEGLGELLRACENEPFFLARLEEYRQCVEDEQAFATWLEKRWGWVDLSSPVMPQVAPSLSPNPDLLRAIGEGPLPALAADFSGLLEGIRQLPLRLNRGRRRLCGSAVSALNGRLPDPDPLPRRPRQEHAPRVNAAYAAASGLGLCGPGTGGRVQALPNLDTVLRMGERDRYALLLDALWNLVPWDDLVSRSRRGGPSGVHDARAWLARILAIFPVNEEVVLRGRVPASRRRLATILEGEAGFVRCLIPVLARGGIWRERLAPPPARGAGRARLISLRVTPLGQALLKVWAKESRTESPPPPFDRILADTPPSPRPAGDGSDNGNGAGLLTTD